nr:peroxisome biogenesis factor 2 isoform X1 [Leptinotarsa decemlineata]XP_023017996.1 peroxisome biogenesis factor 2 isoform X2 [Leptinotarsa decemlineata]XP_023017997.1 peroxisome biogenesis factor 2 isoform X3 [Leptinotarsa decemlineata]
MGKNKLLRVTQMNAVYLDNEIFKALYQIFIDSTKNLPPGFIAPYEPELNLILRLSLMNNSILKSNSTFGQQLLSLKYQNISTTQKLLYVLGNCFEYVKTKLEIWKPSHDINNIIFKIYTLLKLLDFINISIFLRSGEKPLLIERILGLTQVYATDNAQRQFESKYLARELLWNGFIELLVYVLPLVNYHKIKRNIRNLNPYHVKAKTTVVDKRNMTMLSKCAHCGENPILPHHMGCSHIFCYVCLKGNQVADSKFECPVCEHKNPNMLCDRVTVM